MELIQARRQTLLYRREFGGIIVARDNYFFPRNNGLMTAVDTDSDFFLTEIFDTGSTGSKSYTAALFGDMPRYASTRYFNDLSGTSADYWTFIGPVSQASDTRTYSSVGRYIVATIYKPLADKFFIYDNTNGRYVFKGSSVT